MLSLHCKCPGGGMVDALVSGASAARRAGSSPVLGTTTTGERLISPFFVFRCEVQEITTAAYGRCCCIE